MTTFFSNQYVGSGVSETVLPDPRTKVDGTVSNAALKAYVCRFSTPDANAGDVVRLCTLRSNQIILHIGVASEQQALNTFQIGLALSGDNHDGAMLDAEMLSGSRTVPLCFGWEEFYGANTGPPAAQHMHKPLWELVNAHGAATYTKDPDIEYDVTWTWEVQGGTPSDKSIIVLALGG